MGVEMILIPAVISGREIGCGGTPKVWVGDPMVESNVDGDRAFSGPEPDLDAILLATRKSVESTSTSVEIFAVGT